MQTGGQLRRALTFYTLGKPGLWLEVTRAHSPCDRGAVFVVKKENL